MTENKSAEEPVRPPPIREATRTNFNTLLAAARHGDLCSVSAMRIADNSPVTLVCAVNRVVEKGEFELVPLACMLEDENPYEKYRLDHVHAAQETDNNESAPSKLDPA